MFNVFNNMVINRHLFCPVKPRSIINQSMLNMNCFFFYYKPEQEKLRRFQRANFYWKITPNYD